MTQPNLIKNLVKLRFLFGNVLVKDYTKSKQNTSTAASLRNPTLTYLFPLFLACSAISDRPYVSSSQGCFS